MQLVVSDLPGCTHWSLVTSQILIPSHSTLALHRKLQSLHPGIPLLHNFNHSLVRSMNLTFIFLWISVSAKWVLIKIYLIFYKNVVSWIFQKNKMFLFLKVATSYSSILTLHLYANAIWDKHSKTISGSNFLIRIEPQNDWNELISTPVQI